MRGKERGNRRPPAAAPSAAAGEGTGPGSAGRLGAEPAVGLRFLAGSFTFPAMSAARGSRYLRGQRAERSSARRSAAVLRSTRAGPGRGLRLPARSGARGGSAPAGGGSGSGPALQLPEWARGGGGARHGAASGAHLSAPRPRRGTAERDGTGGPPGSAAGLGAAAPAHCRPAGCGGNWYELVVREAKRATRRSPAALCTRPAGCGVKWLRPSCGLGRC